MLSIRSILLMVLLILFNSVAYSHTSFGAKLCQDTTEFSCQKIKRGDHWIKLFTDPSQQDLVMRINRMGIELEPGMKIAIPKNLNASIMDFSPFPKQITAPGEKVIYVSISKLAWGAYDKQGNLLRWGPVSTALGYCPDLHGGCHTPIGKFAIYRKEGPQCVSTKFPIPRGGAPMPYCMYFHGGFALHGSYEVPGYNASHGCVRMLVSDAQWLNQEFTLDEKNVPVIISQQ